eukprot:Platyproteum_vivax@DN2095_c0_g1_i1.p1
MVRYKRRYVVFQVRVESGDCTATEDNLNSACLEAFALDWGDVGYGKLSTQFRIVMWNNPTSLGILRCLTANVEAIVTSLSFITSIYNRKCNIQVLHLGGTLRSCRQTIVHFLNSWYNSALQDLNTNMMFAPDKKTEHLKSQVEDAKSAFEAAEYK